MWWGCGNRRGDWQYGCYVRSVCVGLDEKSASIISGDIRIGTQGSVPGSPMLEVVKWGQHFYAYCAVRLDDLLKLKEGFGEHEICIPPRFAIR